MRHFWYLDIAKSGATLLHVLENTTLYTSKECCIHSRTFIEGNTFSKYYCIYLLQRDSTVFKKNAPPFYAMCPIQYSFKRVLHPFRDFPYSYRQDSFKVLLHLLKHSVTKICYKEMLHVLKEIPHHSPNSVCFPVYPWSIWKGLWQKQRCWRDVSLQWYTMAQKKLL
jgi:hypothetical protein